VGARSHGDLFGESRSPFGALRFVRKGFAPDLARLLCPQRATEPGFTKFQSNGGREPIRVSAPGMGIGAQVDTRCWMTAVRRAPVSRRSSSMGAENPFAQRPPVRAQGIGGARSGRAKKKIHAKHGIFFLA
jgi:hypothetical protein